VSQGLTVSHVAACVSDLARSTRFYTEALGFEIQMTVDVVSPPFDKMTELPGLTGRATFMFHPSMSGGQRLEILEYSVPKCIGPAERRPMNQLGITHLSFVTDDLDGLCERIDRLGGKALMDTKVSGPHGDMMFATDPDGVRLELWQKPPGAA
jgi:lactoylglutathione lyase